MTQAIRGSVSPRHRVSPIPEPPRPLFVAREQELAQLEQWLDQALRGQGRVGFVVGEPGSGKTMLLREFARRAMEAHPDLVVAGGQLQRLLGDRRSLPALRGDAALAHRGCARRGAPRAP